MKSAIKAIVDVLLILATTLGLGTVAVASVSGIVGILLCGNVYLVNFISQYMTNGLMFMKFIWVVALLAFTVDVIIKSYKNIKECDKEGTDNDNK